MSLIGNILRQPKFTHYFQEFQFEFFYSSRWWFRKPKLLIINLLQQIEKKKKGLWNDDRDKLFRRTVIHMEHLTHRKKISSD